MAEAPPHEQTVSKTLLFARAVVKYRGPVALFLFISTGFFFYPILNMVLGTLGRPLPGPTVRIDTNARSLFPDHPYIHAQDKFSKMFGGSSLVAIAVTLAFGIVPWPLLNAVADALPL